MRGYAKDCLLSERAEGSRYFNKDFIEEMVLKHKSNEQNYLRYIYLLI